MFLANIVLLKESVRLVDTGVAGDAIEIAIREQTLCEGAESYAADAFLCQYIKDAGLNVSIQHGIFRLMDEAGSAKAAERVGGDFGLLGELSLLGKFYEIPEKLFVRRLHAGASSHHRAGGPAFDRKWAVRYWTGKNAALSFPLLSLNIDHLRTIVLSRLPMRQKLSLTSSLLRRVRWQRQSLLQELCAGISPSILAASAVGQCTQGSDGV